MGALEVRPVALRPVIAGIRDVTTLVFVGSSGTVPAPISAVLAPDPPPRRWAYLLPLRFVASDSALRAVLAVAPSPVASPRGPGLVRQIGRAHV